MNARPDPYAIIAALREENERLRWEIDDLRARIAPPMLFPAAWRLTPFESKLLATILAASPDLATFERLVCGIYGDGDQRNDYQSIKAFAWGVRRKLAAVGLRDVIVSDLRMGYRIRPGDRARVLSAMEAAEQIGRAWRARRAAPKARAA